MEGTTRRLKTIFTTLDCSCGEQIIIGESDAVINPTDIGKINDN